MPRYLFSGRPGDYVALPPSANAGLVKVAANIGGTGTAWTARTGGTQVTDLLSETNTVITGLSTDADGYLTTFQGPNNVVRLWVDFGGGRRLVEAQTATSTTAASISDATVIGRTILTAATVAAVQTALNVPDNSNVLVKIPGTYTPGGVVLPVGGAWPSPPRPSSDATLSFTFVGPLTLDPPPAVSTGNAGLQPQDICIRG